MFDLISVISTSILNNIIQICIGCTLAMVLINFNKRLFLNRIKKHSQKTIFIIIFSLAGILLPLGSYGIIPIVLALLYIDFKEFIILPMFFSNALFNMLVPYYDPSFVWRTGLLRVLIALFSGIVIGFLLKQFTAGGNNLVKKDINLTIVYKSMLGRYLFLFRKIIDITGKFLILGVIVNAIFHEYILFQSLSLFNSNHYLSVIPKLFSGYDVVNPFFLVTMVIVKMFLDFVKLSAVLSILNRRGIIWYLGYYLILSALLSVSIII